MPPAVPSGPEILLGMDNERNRLRTYASLMRTPYEFDLLEWHATGQIGIVDIATGTMTKFGTPGMITNLDHEIGRVVAALDKKGLRDNTLILFASDNGGATSGLFASGSSIASSMSAAMLCCSSQ